MRIKEAEKTIGLIAKAIRLDEMVMASGAEKISSVDNYQYCQMDQRYVDMLLQVIRNQ